MKGRSNSRRLQIVIKMHLLFLLLVPLTTSATTISLLPLQFILYPSSKSSWTSVDFNTFATAAQTYIDDHNLLQSALGIDDSQYGGISFTASPARRRLRHLQGTVDVVLKGQVSIDAEDVPSQESLTEIISSLFLNGKALFVKQIALQVDQDAGSSNWLREVTDYNVSVKLTRQISQAQAATNNSDDSNSLNLFIIIGVSGAILSFLLLLAGLCYAKRSHHSTEKKPKPTLSPPKKKSILKNNMQSMPTTNSTTPTTLSPSSIPIEESDDESNADFLLARAALNNPHSSIQARPYTPSGEGSVVSGAASSYADDNMSYAFSVDGQSTVVSRGMNMGDVAIGAGGISAFQSENGGVFRWNEDGTKMVYIPASTNEVKPESNQNGFVYDEQKKKWVLEKKNVSFQQKQIEISKQRSLLDDDDSSVTPPRKLTRSRTDDSCVTGLTEFSYDDVAINGMIKQRPVAPLEEGVEVGMDGIGAKTYVSDDVSEFVPSPNVVLGMDDESTLFGVLGGDDADTVSLPPPPPPPQSPQATLQAKRPVSPDGSMITNITEEPGFIKRVPIVHEDKPFDEDIPFDERSRGPQVSKLKPKPRIERSKNPNPYTTISEDAVSVSSSDSAHVLNDLNQLSKFMVERKNSSKMSRTSCNPLKSRSKKSVSQLSTDYNRNKSLP